MHLPHPSALAELFQLFQVTDLAQQRLLTVASETYHRAQTDSGEYAKPPDPLQQAEWHTAEAFWLGVGLLPPIVEWPWRDLHELVGPILPGDVITLGARTGDGKSTFIANLVEPWAKQCRLTIAPLEQSPAVIQVKLACLWLGWHPADVFRKKWENLGMPEPEARAKLQDAIAKQGRAPLRDRVRYCPADSLNRDGLRKLVDEAAEWHHRLVIIDHLHQMDHGDGPADRTIRLTMKLAKQLARRHDLAILFTAQIGRGDARDRRRKFFSPEMGDLMSASAIEQLSDVVLLAYQPLKPETKVKDIDLVLTDQKPYADVFKPNTIALKCPKHRLDGRVKNMSEEFRFERGRISSLPTAGWLGGTGPERWSDPGERGDAWVPSEN